MSTATYAKYVRLTPSAKAPIRGTELAAGLDVYSDFLDEDGAPRRLFDGLGHHDLTQVNKEGQFTFDLKPGHRILIPTGLAMSTSPDLYTRIAPRSGLALKQGLQILGGVVDCDYSGLISVICQNSDLTHSITIHHGMRIAQFVLERTWLGDLTCVDKLEPQSRGTSGFGSTGL